MAKKIEYLPNNQQKSLNWQQKLDDFQKSDCLLNISDFKKLCQRHLGG